jgi:hypothetical protein
MQRRILGTAAVLFLLCAATLWWWWPQMEIETAFFVRMGVVLFAAWLAYDDVQRIPGWLLPVMPVVLVLIVRWPRLLLLLMPVLLGWALLRRILPGRQA